MTTTKTTLRIVSTTPIKGEIIEISGGEWSTYTRYSADSWTVRMGESDEPVYDCSELEAAYQKYEFENCLKYKLAYEMATGAKS